MELLKGSPKDMTGRQDREIRAYEFLDNLGIAFDRTDHPDEPATTMEACAKIDSILNVHICKNLFLCNRQKTNFYLLVMPGDKPFKTKELSKQMGISRLSFADETYMKEFLDLYPGSVSVLGLMNDKEHRVQLVIDEDVLKEEMFGCHPCVNTSSIRFETKELTEKILPALDLIPTLVEMNGDVYHMKIRNAEMSDLETLSKIESESYPKSEAASKKSIKNRLNYFNDCFWVLDDYGEILSFINGMTTNEADLTDEMYDHPEMHNANGDWLMIFSVVTAPEHRHRGYAGKVMNKVIADTKAANRKGIVLTCKEHLIPFYAKFGFINEGLSKSTHGGALWYQMRLTF